MVLDVVDGGSKRRVSLVDHQVLVGENRHPYWREDGISRTVESTEKHLPVSRLVSSRGLSFWDWGSTGRQAETDRVRKKFRSRGSSSSVKEGGSGGSCGFCEFVLFARVGSKRVWIGDVLGRIIDSWGVGKGE